MTRTFGFLLRFVPKPQFTIAQVLVVTAMAAIACSYLSYLKELDRQYVPGDVWDVQLSADGAEVALALWQNDRCCVVVCDSTTGDSLRCKTLFNEKARWVAISQNMTSWVAMFQDDQLGCGSMSSEASLKFPRPGGVKPTKGFRRFAFCGNGARFAVSQNDEASVINVKTGKTEMTIHASEDIFGIGLNRDGTQLATVGGHNMSNNSLGIWRVPGGKRTEHYKSTRGLESPVVWSEFKGFITCSDTLSSMGGSGLCTYDAHDDGVSIAASASPEFTMFFADNQDIVSLAISPDGNTILGATHNTLRPVILVDAKSAKPTYPLDDIHLVSPYHVAISDGGAKGVLVSHDTMSDDPDVVCIFNRSGQLAQWRPHFYRTWLYIWISRFTVIAFVVGICLLVRFRPARRSTSNISAVSPTQS